MIPKSQFLNVLFLQKSTARFVMLHLHRQAVLKTIKFDRQSGRRTIEIQNINSRWMLASEFESGEAVASQRAPELFFFVRLVATKLPGGLD